MAYTPLKLRLLLIVFVLSGFAGLIYQSVWSHYLGLFLGHAAYAQALVLAIFMGGMALGAGLVARAGIRWRSLVRGYAQVELVIGFLGLGFHWIFVSALGLSYELVMPALGQSWLVNGYKWLLAALLILPQTILLGMTFPLMSGGIIRRYPGKDGHVLGGLYFTNSIGAAIGVLVATFFLLPWGGLQGAMITAGFINLAVGVFAWMLSGGPRENPLLPEKEPKGAVSGVNSGSRRKLLLIALSATFLSAAASFVYEIVWIRMLSLAVGNTLHSFELMLASFIAGIALGGLWIRKYADTTEAPMRLVGWLQVLMGLAALLSLVFYANAFAWVGFLMESLSPTDAGYRLFNLGTASIAILIMMPAAFFAGTTLPLFTVSLLRNGQGEGSIGRIYAWNTLGAIVGVFAAIHVLIPLMGLRLTLVLAALVDVCIGLALLRWCADTRTRLVRTGLGAAAAAGVAAVIMVQVPFDPMRLSSGVYRSGVVEMPDDHDLAYYRDGKTASVSVVGAPNAQVRIATNGKVDASIQMLPFFPPSADEPTMVLAAAIPLAYLDEPAEVGVIGFGSGLTTHALLADPNLERVDTIEIEEAMVDGARLFGERVERAYDDPRSNIIIDDAKSYFAGMQRSYDLIVSEPSNPWISGVGNLFSEEFYQFVPRFLEDDGIFVQWLQLYEINEALVGSVLNALAPAFRDYHAYLVNGSDLLIVASQKELDANPDFERLFAGAMGEELQRSGISESGQIRHRKIADASVIRALARLHRYRPNSDYFPVLSLEAPRARFKREAAGQISNIPALRLPLLESLGVSTPLSPAASPGTPEFYSRGKLTRSARSLAEFARGESEVGADEENLEAVSLVHQLRLLTSLCEQWTETEERLLVRQLYQLAGQTLAFLGPDQLDGVLIDPEWQQCDAPDGDFRNLLALLDSAAARDTERTGELAESWLEGMEDLSPAYTVFNPVAFAYLQFALIQQGELQAAAKVEQRFGGSVPPEGQYGQVRSLLLAWLDAD